MEIKTPTLDQMLEEPGEHAAIVIPYTMAGADRVPDDDRMKLLFDAYTTLVWLDGDADDDHAEARVGAEPFHAAIVAGIFAAARIENLELCHTGRSARSLERGTQARLAMDRIESLGAGHPLVADAAEFARLLLESRDFTPEWEAKHALRLLRRVAFDEVDLANALRPLALAVRSRERPATPEPADDHDGAVTGVYERRAVKAATRPAKTKRRTRRSA